MVRGAMAIEQLKTGDKVLIAEACSHHPIGEDIGTVKIPRWLTQYVGGKLEIDNARGRDFPDNIARITSYNVCYTKLLRLKEVRFNYQ